MLTYKESCRNQSKQDLQAWHIIICKLYIYTYMFRNYVKEDPESASFSAFAKKVFGDEGVY